MSPELVPRVMFAPLLIGLVIATMFSGIAVVQVIAFMRNSRDPFRQKLMVWFLWFLDILHISLMFHLVYHYLVSQPMDDGLVWSYPAHILIQVIIIPVAQGLYIMRIWRIITPAQRFIPIALGCLTASKLVGGVFVAIKLFLCQRLEDIKVVPAKPIVIYILAMTPCIDCLIAISLGYALSKAGTNLHWTNSNFTMLLAYFINTGAIVSVFSTSALISFLVSQHSLVFIAMDAITTRFYVNSFLGMVNAQHYLQHNKLPMTLDFHSDISQHVPLDESTQRLSKTINEVGLPLFQPSISKHEDIKMLEVIVKKEALSSNV